MLPDFFFFFFLLKFSSCVYGIGWEKVGNGMSL